MNSSFSALLRGYIKLGLFVANNILYNFTFGGNFSLKTKIYGSGLLGNAKLLVGDSIYFFLMLPQVW